MGVQQGSPPSSLSLNSLPWGSELHLASSSRRGIGAARTSPRGRGHIWNKGPQRGRGARGSRGAGGGRLLPFLSAPPSSLRPPPPPSSLSGRVGGHANFAEGPQVAGYACGVRRGAKRRGAGLPEPWLRIRGPPPTASGIGVVGRADRPPARTPPAWRRFPRREGTEPAAPPSAHSPGTQSGRC